MAYPIDGSERIARTIESIKADQLGSAQLDGITTAIKTIEYEHHEIHGGSSFTAYYTRTTDATNGHRSGIYIKTPASTSGYCHMIAEFSCSTAANFSISEGPTLAANVGTDTSLIYNRNRTSTSTSGCLNNAAVPAAGYITTLTEAEIAADGTYAIGTVLRTAPLTTGAGPKPAGGASRGSQEYILKANTAYLFLITNTAASANAHHILIDWYEHV